MKQWRCSGWLLSCLVFGSCVVPALGRGIGDGEASPSPALDFRLTTAPPLTDAPLTAAFGDLDGDGLPDLALASLTGGVHLFRRLTNGWQAADSLLPGANSLKAIGVTWVDYDNDGDLDLFVVGSGGVGHRLYVNQGHGPFVADAANAPLISPSVGASAAWTDVNRDGSPDVVIMNGGGASQEVASLFMGSPSGIFTRVTTGPIATGRYYGMAAAWGDMDGDGDMDLATMSGWTDSSPLYRNTGSGELTLVSPNPIVVAGGPSGGAGLAWCDFDNDGHLDLFRASQSAGTSCGLYHNNGDGSFTLLSSGPTAAVGAIIGAAWADFDNDGWPDLLLANREGKPFLYRGLGNGAFERVTLGDLPNQVDVSNGISIADFNGDGRLDVAIANWPAASPTVYENLTAAGHFLRVRLSGTFSSRQGLGAKVRLTATIRGAKMTQLRQVGGEDGWATQEAVVHFGLGDSVLAETVRVEWPSGTVTTLSGVAADQVLTVTESQIPQVIIIPPGQLFTNSVTVALRGALPGAEIRYTTNGSEPTPTSVAYAGPFQVTTHVTVKARLFLNGFPVSDVASAEFVPDPGIRIDPAGGRFTNFLDVAISTRVPGAVVRYTTNGVEPSASSALYAKPFRLTAPTVVKASAYVGQFPVSESVSAEFFRVYAWDGDGLPRAWREKFFGTGFELDPRAAADADPDGDGAVNFQEFAAGTDPMDPLSGFAVGIRAIPEIRFHSVAGKKYRITRRDTVTGAAVVVAEGLSATGDSTVFVDDTIRERAGFYVVEAMP